MPDTNISLTVANLKTWATEHRGLALAAVAARAAAELERERVDAYIADVFAGFEFYCEESGERITDADDLYLAGDAADVEEQCAAFYAAADRAHRAHGFEGEAGYCPALIAEDLQRQAERALIEALGAFAGFDRVPAAPALYERALDLALTACLGEVVA